MEDILTVLIVVGGLFIVVGFVADSISRAAVRRKIAARDLSADQIEALLRRRVDPDSILKWGLLAVSIGLALVLIQLLSPDLRDEPIVIGLVLIFAGGALFLYRSIVRRRTDHAGSGGPAEVEPRP